MSNGQQDGDERGDAETSLVGDGAGAERKIPPSVAFEILADSCNRFVLYLLCERGGTVALDELATKVAAWEKETDPESIDDEMDVQSHNWLRHSCIPRLADHGIVTTVDDMEAATTTESGKQLKPYLEFAKEQETRDVERYLEEERRDLD